MWPSQAGRPEVNRVDPRRDVTVDAPGVAAAAARRLYQALTAGDRDALTELLHPDFVGHAASGLPLDMGGEYLGPEAMQRGLWWRIGKSFRVEAQPSELRMLDDGRLFVRGHYRGHAKVTGNTLDAEFIHLLAFSDDGRVVALDQLTDTAKWVTALGEGAPLRTIDYTVSDGLAVICLNRPEQRNAIDLQMAEESLVVTRRIAADPSVRAVLICGNGPALTVGGDIGYFGQSAPEELSNLLGRMTTPFHEAFRILSRIDAPIVTAAHGTVAGGGLGFVYAADIVLAAEDTRFVTAFAGLGLSGDGGGTWHLPRLIGARRAAQAYLQNRPIAAVEALDWGLVNELVPAAELRARATAVAADLARGPTRAFARTRALLRQTWSNDLSSQLSAETEGLQITGATEDAANAIASFGAKREPTFEGR